jgi:peroxiredoxin
MRVVPRAGPLLGGILPLLVLPGWPMESFDLRRRRRVDMSLILSGYPGVSTRTGGTERHLARLRSWQRREHIFNALGYELAFVCARPIAEQRAWIAGSDLRLTLLSDVDLKLAQAPRLPTIEIDGRTEYDDVTVIAHGEEVGHVFYGSREPQNDAETVLRTLRHVHG